MSPRGIRNNNPLNIDKSDVRFQGLAPSQPDDRFWTFLAPEWGIRAAAKILLTYEREGIVTLKAIVSRWAPPSENDTAAYIDAVSDETGFDDAKVLDLRQAAQMVPLLKAMLRHENGQQPYADCTYVKAVQLAGLSVPSIAA